jgi:hypothetical protein
VSNRGKTAQQSPTGRNKNWCRADDTPRRWSEKWPVSREESRDSTRPSDRFAGGNSNRPTRAARDLPRRGVLCFNAVTCSPAPAQLSRPPREIASPPGSVDCCSTHFGRLFPPLFPSPDRPCLFPDPPLLIISPRSAFFTTPLSTRAIISPRSLFFATPYQPSPLSLPDLYFLPPPVINPLHHLFPLSLPTNPLSLCVDGH